MKSRELYPLKVALDKNHLGWQYDRENTGFYLSSMYGGSSDLYSYYAIHNVFMRTDDGNTFLLNDEGLLIDHNASINKGSILGFSVSPIILAGLAITVGRKFYFFDGEIPKVSQIVPASSYRYSPKSLVRLTKGRKNTILKDFLSGLPMRVDSEQWI